MNCWGIRKYFTKSRFSLNEGYIVYMELLSGHEKIITKSRISLNAGTLNRGFTVFSCTLLCSSFRPYTYTCQLVSENSFQMLEVPTLLFACTLSRLMYHLSQLNSKRPNLDKICLFPNTICTQFCPVAWRCMQLPSRFLLQQKFNIQVLTINHCKLILYIQKWLGWQVTQQHSSWECKC
jgi:hypothetical protein